MMERIFSFDTLWWVLMIIYIPACIALIVIVLLQKGKGTGFAGAFGAGAGPGSDTVFGPRMSRSLPIRLTYIAAGIFMTIAIIMSLIAGKVGRGVAPELVPEEAASASATSGALSELGLGTNKVDENRVDDVAPLPAPAEEPAAESPAVVEAPVEPEAEAPSEPASGAEPAPAADAPVTAETPAPAQPDAPVAPEAPATETEAPAAEENPISQ